MNKDNRKLPTSQSGQKDAKSYTGNKDFSPNRFEQEVADEMHVGLSNRRYKGGVSLDDHSSNLSNDRSKRPTDSRNTGKC